MYKVFCCVFCCVFYYFVLSCVLSCVFCCVLLLCSLLCLLLCPLLCLLLPSAVVAFVSLNKVLIRNFNSRGFNSGDGVILTGTNTCLVSSFWDKKCLYLYAVMCDWVRKPAFSSLF